MVVYRGSATDGGYQAVAEALTGERAFECGLSGSVEEAGGLEDDATSIPGAIVIIPPSDSGNVVSVVMALMPISSMNGF